MENLVDVLKAVHAKAQAGKAAPVHLKDAALSEICELIDDLYAPLGRCPTIDDADIWGESPITGKL